MALFKTGNEYRLAIVLIILAFKAAAFAQDDQALSFQIYPGDTILKHTESLVLPGYRDGVPWSTEGFLTFMATHENPASSILLIRFYRLGDKQPRLTCRIGVLPNLPTRIVFPMSYLNAQEIFLPRYPRQLKGTANGERVAPNEISSVRISLERHSGFRYPEKIRIEEVSLVALLPDQFSSSSAADVVWVDSLGQRNNHSWPGKLTGTQELKPAFEAAVSEFGSAIPGEQFSDYLGYTQLRFDSTGFFHTHHDGQRWWFVDPLGYAYLSVAPTGVGPYAHGPVDLSPELFMDLPDESRYPEAWSGNQNRKNLSFLTLNLIRIFGSDWKDPWVESTRHLLLGMQFTGSANWSDRLFHRDGRMPYVYPMWGSAQTKIRLFRDFPDVFNPEFEASARQFAAQLSPMKNDPWMIGYFLGNEPHWAFGDFNLAREMLYTATETWSRKALIRWLEEKYQTPYAFSAAWNLELTAFSELERFILPHEKFMNAQAEEDLKAFTDILVNRYASVICEAVKAADPNHLNLGLRFAWLSSEACLTTGAWFDVFSLNGYSWPEPPATQEIAERLKKPVMIGEFHFGSTDRGLPATGIKGMASQRDRGLAYRHYVENGFARPEIIGLHYFQWNDQPVTGRFDGENYNIGIMDVTYRPYPEMVRSITRTNERLFDIATGKKRPWPFKGRPMPAIYY